MWEEVRQVVWVMEVPHGLHRGVPIALPDMGFRGRFWERSSCQKLAICKLYYDVLCKKAKTVFRELSVIDGRYTKEEAREVRSKAERIPLIRHCIRQPLRFSRGSLVTENNKWLSYTDNQ